MSRRLFILFVATVSCCAHADPGQNIIGKCWEGNDHGGMHKCVLAVATEENSKLLVAEESFRSLIVASPDPSEYLKRVRKTFVSSGRAHKIFKKAQCDLMAAAASMGNGEVEVRLACEASLDHERVNQIEAAAQWLK